MKDRTDLESEIRYAIRLTERTARLYRNIQTIGVFFSILGGSAAMSAVAGDVPIWVTTSGGIILAIFGSMLIAIRPADKAAQNDYDAKRYKALRAKSVDMTDLELEKALEETHTGDVPEIESLREVAYNDVALELNRPDAIIPLSRSQKILQILA